MELSWPVSYPQNYGEIEENHEKLQIKGPTLWTKNQIRDLQSARR
jgi:hypothetical protein